MNILNPLRSILLFALLIGNSFATAQTVQQKTDSKIARLKKLGVDTIVVFEKICTGDNTGNTSYGGNDTCIATKTIYIYWKDNDSAYVQAFDNCYPHPEFKANNLKLLAFYLSNKGQVETEELKRPEKKGEIEIDENGDTLIVSPLYSFSVSYSCDYIFKFYIDGNITEKKCTDYYIYFSEFTDGEPNINWEFNQTIKLKQLMELADSDRTTIEEWLRKTPK